MDPSDWLEPYRDLLAFEVAAAAAVVMMVVVAVVVAAVIAEVSTNGFMFSTISNMVIYLAYITRYTKISKSIGQSRYIIGVCF
jgi:energy-converting hydrogenase Eha subunit C